MKVKSKKGFTLAELLIVMGIITILAAIAIPTFGKQLETARETADEQAIRAALENAFNAAFTDYATTGDLAAAGAYEQPVVITQTKDGFANITPSFAVGSGNLSISHASHPDKDDVFVKFVFEEESSGDGIKLTEIHFAPKAQSGNTAGTYVKVAPGN